MSNVLEGRLDSVNLDKISASKISLRPPKTDDDAFKQLLQSVKDRGVIKPIVINDNGDGTFTLIDGLQRYTAACMARADDPSNPLRKNIDAKIVKIDQEDELIIQIIANNNTVKTRPAEYAKNIVRILAANPNLNQQELAERLSISFGSLQNFLRLNALAEPIKELVDNNDLRVTNAYHLAKLPVTEQMEYLDAAMVDSPEVFIPKIADALKRLKAVHKGEDIVGPTPRVRKLPEIREVYEGKLEELKNQTPGNENPVLQAQVDILAWAIKLDAESVQTWKKDNDDRIRTKAEASLKKNNERETDAKAKSEAAKAKLAAMSV